MHSGMMRARAVDPRRARRRRAVPLLPALLVTLVCALVALSGRADSNAWACQAGSRRNARLSLSERLAGRRPHVQTLRTPTLVPRWASATDEAAPLDAFKDVTEEMWLSGAVKDVVQMGAFVEVKPPSGATPVLGLLHYSKMGQDARWPHEEFFSPGEEIKVRVIGRDDTKGRLQLTTQTTGTEAAKYFKGVSDLLWLDGKVLTVKPGLGAFVAVESPGDDAPQVSGLVHTSQVSDAALEELSIGKAVEVRVLGTDAAANRLKLSMLPVKETDEFKEVPKTTWLEAIVERQVEANGEVIGAMLAVTSPSGKEKRPGLLHVNQMADREEKFEVGEALKVRVIDVDSAQNRLSLTNKQEDEALLGFKDVLASGELITAKVTSVKNFGCVVQVQAPKDESIRRSALLHVSDMDPSQTMAVGEEIQVKLLKAEEVQGTIRLSTSTRKTPLAEMELEEVFESVAANSWSTKLQGKVIAIGETDVLIAAEIPASEEDSDSGPTTVVASLQVADRNETLSVGDAVEARVLKANPSARTLQLTEKRPSSQLATLEALKELSDEVWLEGQVSRLANWGCFVLIRPPEGGKAMDGLVHISRMQEGDPPEDPALVVKVGQEVKVRVEGVTVSGQKGKVSLTMLPKGVEPSPMRPPRKGKAKKANVVRLVSPESFEEFSEVGSEVWLEGEVTSISGFGAFVAVKPPSGGPPLTGLVRQSRIREGYLPDVALEMEVGQEVKVRAMGIEGSPKEYKLELSMLDEKAEVEEQQEQQTA